jgi:sulfatase maturation enzyme AslB (radical SAM superfamily)
MATTRPALSPETAAATLQELWIFPVAPEVCNLACTHCLYAASPQRGKDMTLMCDKGVAYSEGKYFPCPVLVKDPEAVLGTSMREAISSTAREQVRQLKSRKDECAVCLKGST